MEEGFAKGGLFLSWIVVSYARRGTTLNFSRKVKSNSLALYVVLAAFPFPRLQSTAGSLIMRVRHLNPMPPTPQSHSNDFQSGGSELRDEFLESPFEGIRVRHLRTDADTGFTSMLVRMDPGSSYPRHLHHGPEECVVLDGDLRCESAIMRKGDYFCSESLSIHEEQWTENGCLFFVRASTKDEVVAQ